MVRLNSVFISIFLILFLIQFNSAGSLGMSPSYFSFNFEPGLEKTITIGVADSDPNQPILIYLAGDLNEYVNLSSKSFVGSGELIVSFKLPEEIEKPGTNRIIIGSKEARDETGEETSFIVGASAIQIPIDIFVPYPGKYIEAEFEVFNTNEGEDVPYTISLSNLGKEDLDFSYVVEVYSNEELIISANNGYHLEHNQKMLISEEFNSSLFKPGNYRATLKISYSDKEINLEDDFVVGTYFMNITDYTYKFIANKINPLIIEVSSLWNSKIEEVYAEISVTDEGELKSSFKTSSYIFQPLESKNISGYLDASEIEPGRYIGKIQINYENESYSKLVAFYFEKAEMSLTEKLLIGSIIIIIILILVIIILFIFLNKKNKRKK